MENYTLGVDHYVVEMKRMREEEEKKVDTGEQQQALTTFLLVWGTGIQMRAVNPADKRPRKGWGGR